MLQLLRLLSNGTLYSFQEMIVLNEDQNDIVDYYAYRRRVKTLEDVRLNPESPYEIERAVFLTI